MTPSETFYERARRDTLEVPLKFKHDFLPPQDIKRIDTDTGRYYRIPTGEKFRSVTTILSERTAKDLLVWKELVGEAHAKSASRLGAARGTTLHEILELTLRNQKVPPLMPTTLALWKSIIPFLAHINIINALELPLYSRQLKAAGTVDLICNYRNKRSVLDLKTASKEKSVDQIDNYFIQVTAYAIMVEEMYGVEIEQLGILVAREDSPSAQEFLISRNDYLNETLKIFTENQCNLQSEEGAKQ